MYLEDTAQQAGLVSSIFTIEEIGWDGARFVGPDDQPLTTVFKLYPWEWMVAGRVWEISRHGGHHLDGATLEDAAVKQGNPAGVVGAVSGTIRICSRRALKGHRLVRTG